MIKKLGFQVYTVRDHLADAEQMDKTFEALAGIGYTEVHTAGQKISDELFFNLLSKHGIKIIGSHYDYGAIVGDYETTVATHRLWGTTNIGLGGMPKAARTDLGELRKFIKTYNEAAKYYSELGFRLTYHNHAFEFVRIDGYKTVMDILCEQLDPDNVTFVLDTCWVAAGGGDVTAWMRRLAGRIEILHLKDLFLMKNAECGHLVPQMCEVGYGNLDWDSIIRTAEEIGVKHYVVEQDRNFTGNSVESLRMSAEFLQRYM